MSEIYRFQDNICKPYHNDQSEINSFYDYEWIDELAGAIEVLRKHIILPESLIEELQDVSSQLTAIYNEACRCEVEMYHVRLL